MTKSEIISWYRIQEMFRFHSFHMYGIIMTAVCTGSIGIQFIKRNKLKDSEGFPIVILDKEPGSIRYWIGGVFFGLGWALAGACPGPMYILVGTGVFSILIVIQRSYLHPLQTI